MPEKEYGPCPRCGGDIPNTPLKDMYPGAISRWDNKTMICSDCGTSEATCQLYSSQIPKGFFGDDYDYVAASVHPVDGVRAWVHPPTEEYRAKVDIERLLHGLMAKEES
jgi:hypothetical protein